MSIAVLLYFHAYTILHTLRQRPVYMTVMFSFPIAPIALGFSAAGFLTIYRYCMQLFQAAAPFCISV